MRVKIFCTVFTALIVIQSIYGNEIVYKQVKYLVIGNNIKQPPQPRTPEDMARHETEWMKNKLSLTKEQTVKVDSINLQFAIATDNLFKQYKDDREVLHSKMVELEKQKRNVLQAILTKDQLQKYDEELSMRHKQRPPHNNKGLPEN